MRQDLIVSYQISAFMVTIAAGLFIGLCYDAFRVLRVLFHPSRWLLFFLDFIFWLIMTVIVFAALLASSFGDVRAYVLIGLALGGSAYALVLSKTLYRVMECTGNCLFNLAGRVARPVFSLIRWLWSRAVGIQSQISSKAVSANKALCQKISKISARKRRN